MLVTLNLEKLPLAVAELAEERADVASVLQVARITIFGSRVLFNPGDVVRAMQAACEVDMDDLVMKAAANFIYGICWSVTGDQSSADTSWRLAITCLVGSGHSELLGLLED